MEVFTTRDELASWISRNRNEERILVPTMGALHKGHTSLFDLARSEAGSNGKVVATIFVNPTQFGPNEDLDAYPRQLEEDLEQCREHNVDVVFAPTVDQIYHNDTSISVTESSLSKYLCGASRPGHFDGVCLIVAKLFLLTQPSKAVFGEKDFQQLAIIRRLVRDLDFPIDIIGGETVREEDGLAMSSRNAYLSREQREAAPVIFQSLSMTAKAIAESDITNPEDAMSQIRSALEGVPGSCIDYVAIVDASTLEPLKTFGEPEIRILAAVFFGKTRLIDNVGIATRPG